MFDEISVGRREKWIPGLMTENWINSIKKNKKRMKFIISMVLSTEGGSNNILMKLRKSANTVKVKETI